MSLSTSLLAVADALDPRMAYWSVTLRNGKTYSERHLVPTWRGGVRGVRKLDWLEDIVGTGDIKHVKEVTLHCPDGRTAVVESGPKRWPVFQFRQKSMNVLGGLGPGRLEFLCVGRVIDRLQGWCECFIWDYYNEVILNDKDEFVGYKQDLVAYRSNINNFGAWRDTMTPMSALSMEVQGWRI